MGSRKIMDPNPLPLKGPTGGPIKIIWFKCDTRKIMDPNYN